MQLLILIAIVTCCSAVQVDYRPCTFNGQAPTGDVRSINIEPLPADGCSYSRGNLKGLCHFTSNSTYNGTITFRSSEASLTAKNEAMGHLGALGDENFPVTPADACQGSLHCPVTPNMEITYKVSVKVPEHKAGLTGVGEWRVIGDNDKAIICFLIPFELH